MKNQSYFVRTMIGLAILALASIMAAGQDTSNSSVSDQFGDAKGSPIHSLITNNNNANGNSVSLLCIGEQFAGGFEHQQVDWGRAT